LGGGSGARRRVLERRSGEQCEPPAIAIGGHEARVEQEVYESSVYKIHQNISTEKLTSLILAAFLQKFRGRQTQFSMNQGADQA
jgi:hypothetical protein